MKSVREALKVIVGEMTRPSVLFRPRLWLHYGGVILSPWGEEIRGSTPYQPCWVAQYGPGEFSVIGETPAEAMRKFDEEWVKK